MPALFSSFVWHLAGMRFVQVDRLERGFCYSYGMLCDSSDTSDALGMYFKCILFMIIQDVFFFFFFFGRERYSLHKCIIQDVLLASALLVLQWTSHFFEVVIVALV